MKIETILCVPGPWKDKPHFIESVITNSDGYISAGEVLMHVESGKAFELVFEGRDPRMSDAFRCAGPHWATSPEMEAIEHHKSVAYIIADGGSLEKCHEAMEAGNALLRAGGLGVKVESSGVSHAPAYWAESSQLKLSSMAHRCFVVYVTGAQAYSCGMHNLGMPDCVVSSSDSDEPCELLRTFSFYLFAESPQIEEGQTFSVSKEAPVYRILRHDGIDYGRDSLFTNPFGAWELRKCM